MAPKTSTNRVAAELNGTPPPPEKREVVTIPAPNFEQASFRLIGTAPLVVNKFSAKAQEQIAATQKAGSTARTKGRKKDPKNFEALCEGATYRASDGWAGINAAAFRNAAISACRLVGFKMTMAKLSLFTEADGYDAEDGTPLVRITKGEPRMLVGPVRLPNGSPDMRSRPIWAPGWEVVIRVRYDADQFTRTDITNLIMRAGMQVGVCEGRPDSKNSAGLQWGLFRLAREGD